MIKPLNSVSDVSFKSGLEDYQQQIRDKKEPRYQLTLSPGSNYVPPQEPKKPFKQRFADFIKGFNNITGMAAGVVKGVVKGAVFGGVAGAIVKSAEGKDLKGFIGSGITKIFDCIGDGIRAIPKLFTKSPIENLKNLHLKELPKKYFDYLGNNKAAKALAIGVGLLTLGFTLIKTRLRINRKNADVDHSLNLKH